MEVRCMIKPRLCQEIDLSNAYYNAPLTKQINFKISLGLTQKTLNSCPRLGINPNIFWQN